MNKDFKKLVLDYKEKIEKDKIASSSIGKGKNKNEEVKK